MSNMEFADKTINLKQLITELEALNIADNAFGGVRKTNRRVQGDGSIVKGTSYIEVKFRSEIPGADQARVTTAVNSHVAAADALSELDTLKAENTAYLAGDSGQRLTEDQLRRAQELML